MEDEHTMVHGGENNGNKLVRWWVKSDNMTGNNDIYRSIKADGVILLCGV